MGPNAFSDSDDNNYHPTTFSSTRDVFALENKEIITLFANNVAIEVMKTVRKSMPTTKDTPGILEDIPNSDKIFTSILAIAKKVILELMRFDRIQQVIVPTTEDAQKLVLDYFLNESHYPGIHTSNIQDDTNNISKEDEDAANQQAILLQKGKGISPEELEDSMQIINNASLENTDSIPDTLTPLPLDEQDPDTAIQFGTWTVHNAPDLPEEVELTYEFVTDLIEELELQKKQEEEHPPVTIPTKYKDITSRPDFIYLQNEFFQKTKIGTPESFQFFRGQGGGELSDIEKRLLLTANISWLDVTAVPCHFNKHVWVPQVRIQKYFREENDIQFPAQYAAVTLQDSTYNTIFNHLPGDWQKSLVDAAYCKGREQEMVHFTSRAKSKGYMACKAQAKATLADLQKSYNIGLQIVR